MKGLKEYITLNESEVGSLRPTNRDELMSLIIQRIKEQGSKCDLNDIDVSRVDDMCWLFSSHGLDKFDGDISEWDVSRVKSMYNMFENSPLDGKEPSWYKE